MKLFGFEIVRSPKNSEESKDLQSFVAPETDDGALVVASGGAYGMYADFEAGAKNDSELVTKYRQMYLQPECQMCVEKIVNEAIVKEDDKPIVELNLDALQQSERVKDAIRREWRTIIEMLEFNSEGYNLFTRWYVDSKLTYQIIIDSKDPKSGIQELRYIDPRKLRKVRTTKQRRVGNALLTDPGEEFYVFNPSGFKNSTPQMTTSNWQNQGLKISSAAIVQITSGLMDPTNTSVLGFLHKAIKPLNQLRMMEDATVIYRISRSSEKRIFYIDVGNLPKQKAEQYLNDMATKHKNRVVYDSTTGDVRDDRKFMTMYEDMWFPTRGGDRGTKVETLPAGQSLGELADVEYFKGKLYDALNVPRSRLQDGGGAFNIGRSSEIQRDELEFQKFIDRLRTRFGKLFTEILGKQLILKGIITEDDWDEFRAKIGFDFARDNYAAELKDTEILNERLTLAGEMDAFEGKYFSRKFIQKTAFRMTQEEIDKNKAEIEAEKKEFGESNQTYQDFDSGGPAGQEEPAQLQQLDGPPDEQQPVYPPQAQ